MGKRRSHTNIPPAPLTDIALDGDLPEALLEAGVQLGGGAAAAPFGGSGHGGSGAAAPARFKAPAERWAGSALSAPPLYFPL